MYDWNVERGRSIYRITKPNPISIAGIKTFSHWRSIIGASLSKPHTSRTTLWKCVNICACLLAAIYPKF